MRTRPRCQNFSPFSVIAPRAYSQHPQLSRDPPVSRVQPRYYMVVIPTSLKHPQQKQQHATQLKKQAASPSSTKLERRCRRPYRHNTQTTNASGVPFDETRRCRRPYRHNTYHTPAVSFKKRSRDRCSPQIHTAANPARTPKSNHRRINACVSPGLSQITGGRVCRWRTSFLYFPNHRQL